jgi:hypothetical protein
MALSWPDHLVGKRPYFGHLKPVSWYGGKAARHFETPQRLKSLGSKFCQSATPNSAFLRPYQVSLES